MEEHPNAILPEEGLGNPNAEQQGAGERALSNASPSAAEQQVEEEAMGLEERVLMLLQEMGYERISQGEPTLGELVAFAKRRSAVMKPLREVEKQFPHALDTGKDGQAMQWLEGLYKASRELEELAGEIQRQSAGGESRWVLDSLLRTVEGDKARIESFGKALQAWQQQRLSEQIAEVYRLISMPGELGKAQEMVASIDSSLQRFPDWPVAAWREKLKEAFGKAHEKVQEALTGNVRTLLSQAERWMQEAESAPEPYTALSYLSWSEVALEQVKSQRGQSRDWQKEWDERLDRDTDRLAQLQKQFADKTKEWTRERRLELLRKYVNEYKGSGEQSKADFINLLLAFDPELENAIVDLSVRERLRHRREDAQRARSLYHEAKALWNAEKIRDGYLLQIRDLLRKAQQLDPGCEEIKELKQEVDTVCLAVDSQMQQIEQQIEEIQRLLKSQPDQMEEIGARLEVTKKALKEAQEEAGRYGPHPSAWEQTLAVLSERLQALQEKHDDIQKWAQEIRDKEKQWQEVQRGRLERELIESTFDWVQSAPPDLPASLWEGLYDAVNRECSNIERTKRLPDGFVRLMQLERVLWNRSGSKQNPKGFPGQGDATFSPLNVARW